MMRAYALCCGILLQASFLYGQMQILIVDSDTGKTVPKARIIVETSHKIPKVLESGMTDDDGLYTTQGWDRSLKLVYVYAHLDGRYGTASVRVNHNGWPNAIKIGIDIRDASLNRPRRSLPSNAMVASDGQGIRRAAFAFTVLPPTIDEVDDFVTDTPTDAYGKLIDRYFAPPSQAR